MMWALLVVLIVGPGLLISWWVISIFRLFNSIEEARKNDLLGTSGR